MTAHHLTGVAGVTERILVVEVFAWFVVLGALAFRLLIKPCEPRQPQLETVS